MFRSFSTKSLISIEVDEKLFQDPSGNWDLDKLGKLKTHFHKASSSQNVTINCGKIDGIIESVEKKEIKDNLNKPEHESKITKKLSKMVDDKINKSPSITGEWKDLDEKARAMKLLMEYHSPHTIENYVNILYGTFKMKEFPHAIEIGYIHIGTIAGKLKGVIPAVTPSGCLIDHESILVPTF